MAESTETSIRTKTGNTKKRTLAGFQMHPFLPVYARPCKTLAEIVENKQKSKTAGPNRNDFCNG